MGAAAGLGALSVSANVSAAPRHGAGPGTIARAARAAQHRFGVPASLLEAIVTLSKGGKKASVYGKPGGTSSNVIGSTPSGSVYLSPWSVTVSGTTWYAINYNHRQAWVPSSEVTSTRTT